MDDNTIGLTFSATVPDDACLATLDRIAGGSGDVPAADIRELARITAIVAREANAVVGLLQQLSSLGNIRIA